MTELSTFIDAHPWVTLGVFVIAAYLADSIGKIGRRVYRCEEDK